MNMPLNKDSDWVQPNRSDSLPKYNKHQQTLQNMVCAVVFPCCATFPWVHISFVLVERLTSPSQRFRPRLWRRHRAHGRPDASLLRQRLRLRCVVLDAVLGQAGDAQNLKIADPCSPLADSIDPFAPSRQRNQNLDSSKFQVLWTPWNSTLQQSPTISN